MKKELAAKGDSALAIVQAFMKSGRSNQKQIMELTGTKAAPSKESTEKGLCFKCNQSGHRQANCPNKSTCGIKKNHGTQLSPPPQCPACAKHHMGKDANGKTWYKNRLSACNKFRG